MPKYSAELFGQLIYSPEISYEDLLPLEEELVLFVRQTLEHFNGQFISFEPEGDHTFFQCVFQNFDESFFTSVGQMLKDKIKDKVEGKLFFVDKALSSVYFYALNNGALQAHKVTLPTAGPIDKAVS
ncbi:MAG: hypothetical protein LBV76_06175, partial [Deltaproteobacteria bacterium]|nr:hypothetical protein [Deltaproteobacteria bacterium]